MELVWTWKCICFPLGQTEAINEVATDVLENLGKEYSWIRYHQKIHRMYHIKIDKIEFLLLCLVWIWKWVCLPSGLSNSINKFVWYFNKKNWQKYLESFPKNSFTITLGKLVKSGFSCFGAPLKLKMCMFVSHDQLTTLKRLWRTSIKSFAKKIPKYCIAKNP